MRKMGSSENECYISTCWMRTNKSNINTPTHTPTNYGIINISSKQFDLCYQKF